MNNNIYIVINYFYIIVIIYNIIQYSIECLLEIYFIFYVYNNIYNFI